MQKEGKLVWMRAMLIYSFSSHQILHEVGFQEIWVIDWVGIFPLLFQKDQPRLAQTANGNHCGMCPKNWWSSWIHLSKSTHDVIWALAACLLMLSLVTFVCLICPSTQKLWLF